MSYALTYSRAYVGVAAPLVRVETHLSGGLPALTIVGLPETAVRESKDRVRSAIINAGFEFPAKRITINLAPADLPKEGTCEPLYLLLPLTIRPIKTKCRNKCRNGFAIAEPKTGVGVAGVSVDNCGSHQHI